MSQPNWHNWTPEQWYAFARAQVEAEMRWLEYQRIAMERSWTRERMQYSSSDKMTRDDQWVSAKSGLFDLIIGAPLLFVRKLLGG